MTIEFFRACAEDRLGVACVVVFFAVEQIGMVGCAFRTREPFFSNLRTFGLKNLRTHEPSNLRTFGLIGCNPANKDIFDLEAIRRAVKFYMNFVISMPRTMTS